MMETLKLLVVKYYCGDTQRSRKDRRAHAVS